MNAFEKRNVVVTGATRGIGKATVEAFLAQGARVFATGRDEDRLRELQTAHGSRVRTAAADMGRVDEVRGIIGRAKAELGTIDVLVNNAGTTFEEPVLEVTERAWGETLAVNLTAAFFASQEAARHMVADGGGAIVNVSSIDAYVAECHYVHYSVSKAGLSMMTKAFAYELGHLGVRCNAVAPGVTLTAIWKGVLDADDGEATYRNVIGRIPLRRGARPDEQAAVILFLASDQASFINGETIIADGGQLCGYWDRPELEPVIPAGEPQGLDY